MSLVAVVDTNVVVAGLLTGQVESPVARVLDGMLSARFAFAVSEALLAEYRDVLTGPELRKQHRLSSSEIETLLVELVRHAIVLPATPSSMRSPDPGDQHLWDLAATRDELVLVTGDSRLLNHPEMHDRVVTPLAFVQAHKVG